jgi:uncharacterized membrane protein YccC
MRSPAALAGLLGGLCWLGAFVADHVGRGGLVDALTWAGVALLAIAALGTGAGLVSRSAPLLRVFVAVCFAILVGSVLQVLRQSGDPVAVDAACGAVIALVSAVAMTRARPVEPEPVAGHRVRSRGSHAR